ncbi:phosphatidylinositol 4,5-bisphosphate 3-kinase catalytic subunit delta isoform [Parasteatoda tepidariorum]|uniref:phosphatidylinositol 4,5-bisphosphate 3-kinase catalytic subunit delta isoform n=1 Tax=Parasteatoda tepidariorum TaxID=114398 RepID=UPI001C721843|nr:phosphatidylinositol 4,5-bisphosphate 3-kinase catalytic subunit delta isoform [Parasteatoda tepidariorum]XP_042908959.1 phosphatidylinositol 4,5-bisphosphate 3-kinase catalytic subunit delta isoform [Parasteatoda tepidariorum]
MEIECSPYANIEVVNEVQNCWDQDVDSDIAVDILMPNGYFMTISVNRYATLHQIKEEVWEGAQNCPLFSLLKDSDAYVFQCVNSYTGNKDELVEEDRMLFDVRPFQAFLRLAEKEGDVEEKKQNSRLGNAIGQSLEEFDEQNDSEINDFRKQMRQFCESVCAELELESWEKRVLRQYPVSMESSPKLPTYLQKKIFDDNLVVAISIGQQCSESTFKISVSPSLKPEELLDLVLQKKGPSIGLYDNHITQSHVLKVCGLEEYLIGICPLSQYRYIRECISSDKTPELVLVSRDKVLLEASVVKTEKNYIERQRSHSFTNDSVTFQKLKKSVTVSAWTIDDPIAITLHFVGKLDCDIKSKIAVQCAIYYSDECLTSIIHSTEKCLEEEKYHWNETFSFELELHHLPRMAKLCFCIYEVSPTQKNGRFRKCQDKFVCPIAWVNTTVFDYKDNLKSTPITLSTWSYPQEIDENSAVMMRPLGTIAQNPNPKNSPGALCFSFKKYHTTFQVVYPNTSEILEYAKEETSLTNGSMPQASKSYLQQLRQICEKDSLYQLHEQDKQLMWFLRNDCCEQLPNSLPKLLRCVKWNDRREIAQMTQLMEVWPQLTPYKALELLDYAYPDCRVRSFAVKCLEKITDEELSLYLLQLVQALKHESYLQNSLVEFLLERALKNRHIGHRLFWLLRSETDFPEASLRFRLILEAYCRSLPSHLESLEKQVEALRKLRSANNDVMGKVYVKKEGREKLKSKIQKLLGKSHKNPFCNLHNPLDPRFKFGRIKIEKCKFLDSKMRPLWLAFENIDTYGKDVFLIFKNGDDLRQDMLILQMLRIMDRLWKDEGLDFRMIPYQCMATGHKVGLIEVVPDSDTIANIQKEKGFTATSAFKKGSILSWLKDHNPDDMSLSKAAEEFTLSCAGYCVATYVLGVADRHSDNIMIKTNGQLFHIDFGHILGKFKEKFGIKRERVPFVLTHDFVYIITKGHTQKSQEFTKFQQYCERAFMILRRWGPLVISLFAMMLSTGIPELSSEKDLDYLRETLVLDMSDNDALKHFRLKFDEALKNSWKTSANWMAHNWAKDNKMSD